MATAFLMYHELELAGRQLCQSEPGYTRYILPVSNFEEQLRYLKELGYRGVSVGTAIEFAGTQQVAISFDDGCETDWIAAAPLLAAVNFGATFYVTAGFLGKQGYLSPAQLRELSNSFEIGCHSMSHAYLPDVDEAGLHREIQEAKVRIEQCIGRGIEHFSCPGGRFDARVIERVRAAGYRTMATSVLRLNSRATDLYQLGRFPVMRTTTLHELSRACRGEGFRAMNLVQGVRNSAKKLLGNRLYDHMRTKLLGTQGPE